MDHKPLITIFGSKKGLRVYTAYRLLSWGTNLLKYNFKIEFITSKNICHAGSLSRLDSPKYGSLWKLHYCYSKDEFVKSETMFARNIKSVFDKLIPWQAKFKKTVSPHKKHFYPGDKVLFKVYKNMTFWKVRTIKQRIVELVYIVQGPKNIHKRHMNQLKKCRLNESEESPQNTREEPIDAIFYHFDLDTPQVSPEVRCSGRKKKFTQQFDVNTKSQKYY